MAQLPQVGATAVILGMTAFTANARSVNAQLRSIGASAATLERQTTSAFANIEGAVGGILSVAGVAAGAIAALGVAAIIAGAKYEAGLNAVGAISDATSGQIAKLNDAQLELSRHSSLSADSLNKISEEMVKAGLSTEQLTGGVLKAVNALVVASHGELEAAKAATLMQVALASFGIAASDAMKVADTANAVVQRSALTFNGFSDAVRQGGNVASHFGLTFEQFGAIVGVVGKTIQSGTEVGTGLRVMFQRLEAPSAKATAELNKYHISLYTASGQARPFVDVLDGLNQAFGKNALATGKVTQQERDHALAVIFGARSIKTIIPLIEGGTEAYNAMLGEIHKLKVEDIANAMLQPMAVQAKIVANNIVALGIAFAEGLTPFLSEATGGLLKFLQSLSLEQVRSFGGAIGSGLYNALSTVGVILNGVILPRVGDLFSALGDVGQAIDKTTGVSDAFGRALGSAGSAAGDLATRLISAVASALDFITAGLHTLARAFEDPASGVSKFRDAVVAALEEARRKFGEVMSAVGVFADASIKAFNSFVSFVTSGSPLIKDALLGIATVLAIVAVENAAAIGSMIADFVLLQAAIVARNLTIAQWRVMVAVSMASAATETTQAIGRMIIQLGLLTASWLAANVPMAIYSAGVVSNFAIAGAALAAYVLASVGGALATAAAWSVVAVNGIVAFAASWAVQAAAAIQLFALVSGSALATAGVIIQSMAVSAASGLASFGQVAVAAARVGISAFVSMGAAALASAGGILAAIAPLLIGIAAIATAVGLVYVAWANNWGGIQGIVGKAVAWIIQKLNDFLDALEKLPLIGEFIGGARSAISGFLQGVPQFAAAASSAVGGFVQSTIEGFKLLKGIQIPTSEDFAAELADLEKKRKEAQDAAKAGVAKPAGEEPGATTPGEVPSDASGKAAANKVKTATERAAELVRDFNDQVDKETGKTTENIGKLYTRAFDELGKAALKNIDEITKADEEAARKRTEAGEQNRIKKDIEDRRKALDKSIKDDTEARKERLDGEEIAHKRELENTEETERRKQQAAEETFRQEQENAAETRRREREDQDATFKHGQELRDRRLKDDQDAENTSLKIRQDAEDRALKDRQDARSRELKAEQEAKEKELKAEQDANDRAIKAKQDAEEAALRDTLADEKRAFDDRRKLAEIDAKDTKDRAAAQAEFEVEVSRGVKLSIAQGRLDAKLKDIAGKTAEDKARLTADEQQAAEERAFEAAQQKRLDALKARFDADDLAREAAHQAAIDKLRTDAEAANLALKATFEAEDLKQKEAHEKAVDALQAAHAKARDDLTAQLEKEALSRSRTREDEDIKYKRGQEKDFNDFRIKQEDETIKRRRGVEDKERERTLALEASDREFHEQQENRRVELDKTLDDEEYQRKLAQIQSEHDERITKADDALKKETALTQSKLAQDIVDLRENLGLRVDEVKKSYLDKLDDILREGGQKLQPTVDTVTQQITDALDGITTAANEATDALAKTFEAQEKLTQAQQRKAVEQSGGAGAGGAGQPLRPGGKPGETAAEVTSFLIGNGATPEQAAAAVAKMLAAAGQAGPGLQYGGVVPGPYGSLQWVLAHGGEQFEGIGGYGSALTAVRMAESMWSRGIGASGSVVNNYSYNVEANYGRMQPEGSVARDLSALVALTKR